MLVQLSSKLRLTNFEFLLVARKIPFDDPDVLNYVRIAYVTAQVIILSVYYYVSFVVSLQPYQTMLIIADVCMLG